MRLRRYLLDRMVLRPSRHPIEFEPQRRVMLEVDGFHLESFVRKSFADDDPADLVVLKFPGTAGRAERSTEFPIPMLGSMRVAIWTWNPPGYGRSRGRASLHRIAEASLAFCSEVMRRSRNPDTRVWMCGNSLGCVTALHVASAGDPPASQSGLILRNPPPLLSVVRRVARRYPMGQLSEPVVSSLCDSMNAMLTAPRVALPAVFLQSELDTLVPIADQNQLIRQYAGPSQVVLLDGLGHADVATDLHEPRIERSLHWLCEQTGCRVDESVNGQ